MFFPRNPRGGSVWHHRRSVTSSATTVQASRRADSNRSSQERCIPCAASATAGPTFYSRSLILSFSPSLIPLRARAELLGERVSGCVAPISGGESNNPVPPPIYQWQAEQEVCAIAGRWRRVRAARNVSPEGKNDRKKKERKKGCPATELFLAPCPCDTVRYMCHCRWYLDQSIGYSAETVVDKRSDSRGGDNCRMQHQGAMIIDWVLSSLLLSHLFHLCGNGLIICLSVCLSLSVCT